MISGSGACWHEPLCSVLYLRVRKENVIACLFYQLHGMRLAGTVGWKNRSMPGLLQTSKIR